MIFVYVVCGSRREADLISRTLLKEKLVACTNQWSGMTSRFYWKGKLETSKEVVLVLKTTRGLFERVRKRVRSIHSYDTPCIVELRASRADARYLGWIKNSLKR